MEPKDEQFVDGELKKINIKDFQYIGKRQGSKCIFVYEHKVDDKNSYAIVLDGESDKDVEISAETSFNLGEDERRDQLATEKSWQEAIKYLKTNAATLARDTMKKGEKHLEEHSKVAKIVKHVTASWMEDNWTGNLTYRWQISEYNFRSDLFKVVSRDEMPLEERGNETKSTVLFNLIEKDSDSLYDYVRNVHDNSKYIATLVERASKTFEDKMNHYLANETDDYRAITALFADHNIEDLSRVDNYYEQQYEQYKDAPKEIYDKERDAVKAAITNHKAELEDAQDIDFKVKITAETEADEADRIVNENNADKREYTEYTVTFTVYGILDGKEKKLWALSKLIDCYKNEQSFVDVISKKLTEWFGIYFIM